MSIIAMKRHFRKDNKLVALGSKKSAHSALIHSYFGYPDTMAHQNLTDFRVCLTCQKREWTPLSLPKRDRLTQFGAIWQPTMMNSLHSKPKKMPWLWWKFPVPRHWMNVASKKRSVRVREGKDIRCKGSGSSSKVDSIRPLTFASRLFEALQGFL